MYAYCGLLLPEVLRELRQRELRDVDVDVLRRPRAHMDVLRVLRQRQLQLQLGRLLRCWLAIWLPRATATHRLRHATQVAEVSSMHRSARMALCVLLAYVLTACNSSNGVVTMPTPTACAEINVAAARAFVDAFNQREADKLLSLFSPVAAVNYTAIGHAPVNDWQVQHDGRLLRQLLSDRMAAGEKLNIDADGSVRGTLPDGRTRNFNTKFAVDCRSRLIESLVLVQSAPRS